MKTSPRRVTLDHARWALQAGYYHCPYDLCLDEIVREANGLGVINLHAFGPNPEIARNRLDICVAKARELANA